MPMIVVTSSLPHRPCANRVFSGAKAFPLDTFDADELRMILADGHLTVVVGDVLTADAVDEFVENIGGEPDAGEQASSGGGDEKSAKKSRAKAKDEAA